MTDTVMPHDKIYAKQISDRMKEQEKSSGGKDRLPSDRVILRGQPERLPIYRFEISNLFYNKANGRIAAELRAKEDELGRELDPTNVDDQQILGDLLLAVRHDENDNLKADLREKGQLAPGIITCDGILINGNRRRALLQQLFNDINDQRYAYIEVHVLPSDVTKREIWLIEAGIQLSAMPQLDYDPINHLLKLREGELAGLSTGEMAHRIYGVDEEKLREDLERLTLMDSYLRDCLDKEDRYYLLKERNEHFINLQRILRWAARPRGKKINWTYDKSDLAELTNVAFYYIRGRFSHWRIRDLRDIFCNKSSWDEVRKVLELDAAPPGEEPTDNGEPDNLDDFDEMDEPAADELDELAIVERDRIEENAWHKRNKRNLQSHFEDAKEQQQINSDSR